MDITDRVIIDDDGDVWTVNLSTEDPVSPSSNSSPPSECSNDENTFLTKNDSNIFPITTNIKTEPDDTAIVTCTGSTSNDDPVASPYHSSTPPACSDENISLPNNESNIQIIPNNESNIKIIQNNELNIQIIIKTEPTDGSHANSSSVASHNNSTDKPILLSHGVQFRKRRKDCHSQIRADPQCSDGLRNILALRCQRNVEVQPSLPATKYNLATSSNPRLISFDSIVRNRLLSSPTSYSNSCPVPKSSLPLTRSQESNHRNVKGMDSIPLSHVRTTCTLTTSTFANTSSVPSQITTTTVSRSVLNENSSNMKIKAEPVDRSLSGYSCALPGTAQNMHQSQVTTEEVEVKAVQEVRGTGQTVVVGSENLPRMTPSVVGHMQYPQPNRCDPQGSDNWLQDFDVLSYEPFTNYPVKIFLPSNKIRCLECGTFLKKHKRCMQCSMCSFSTVCDASLSTHYKKKHQVVLNDLKAKELCFDENLKPREKYKCRKCGLALENSPLNIKKHMNFHGRSGFVCFFCMRACYSCSDFIKHLKKCGYSKEMYPCTSTDNPGVSLFLSMRNTLEVFCNTFKFFIEKGRIPAKQHCCILRRTHKHLQGLHWHYIQRAVYTLIAKRSISTAKKQKQVNDVSIYQKAKPQRRYETANVQNGGEAFPPTATVTRSVPTLLATLAAPFFNDVTPITDTTWFNNGTTLAAPFFHNKTTFAFGANSGTTFGTLMNNSSFNTTHITNHGTTLITVANSGTTLTTVVNRTTSMTIANHSTTLTTVAHSGTTPMTIANSGEALTTVANSGTTLSIVANMGLKFLKGVENTATTFTTGVVNSKTMHTTPITNSNETLISLSKGTAIKTVAKDITTLTYKKPDAGSRTIPTTVTRSGTTLTKSLPVPVANSGTILATPFPTSGSTMANPFVNSVTIPLLQNSFVNSGTIPLLTNSYTNRGTIPVAPVANIGTLSATPFANIGTIPVAPVANVGTLSATPFANIGTIPATPVANIGTLSATPIANTGTIPAAPVANMVTIPATPVANIGTIPGAPIANIGTIPATPVASGTTSSLSGRIVPVLTLVNGKFQITLKLRETVSQELPTGVPNIKMEGSRTTDGYNAKTSQTASATQAISGMSNIKIEPSTLGGCGAAISGAASAMQAISGTHNIRVEPSTLGGCSAPTILTSATVQPTCITGTSIPNIKTEPPNAEDGYGGPTIQTASTMKCVSGVEVTSSISAPTIPTSATLPTTGTSVMSNIKIEDISTIHEYTSTIQTPSTTQAISAVPNIKMEPVNSLDGYGAPTMPTTHGMEYRSTIDRYSASTTQTASTAQAISGMPNIKMEVSNTVDGYVVRANPTASLSTTATIPTASLSTTATIPTTSLSTIATMPTTSGMEESSAISGYSATAIPTAAATVSRSWSICNKKGSSKTVHCTAPTIQTMGSTMQAISGLSNPNEESSTAEDCIDSSIQTSSDPCIEQSTFSSVTESDLHVPVIVASSNRNKTKSSSTSMSKSFTNSTSTVARTNKRIKKSDLTCTAVTSISSTNLDSTTTVASTNRSKTKSDLTCTVANTSRNKTQSDSISMNRSSAKSDVSCSVAPTRKSLTNFDSTATVACSNKTMTKSDLTSNVANTSGNKTISDSTSADRCLTKSDLTNTITMADLVSIVISKSLTKLDSTSTVASTNKTVTKSNITCTVGNTSRDLTNLDSIATVASTNKILTMTDLAGNVANTSRNLTNLDSTTTVASTNRSKTKSDLTCTVANTSRNKTQSDSISMNRSSAKSDVSCSVAPTSRSLTNLDSTTTVGSTNKTVTMTDLACTVAITTRSLVNLDLSSLASTNTTKTKSNITFTVGSISRDLTKFDSTTTVASTGRMLPQEEKENPKTEGQGRAFTIRSSGNEKTVNQQSLISSSSYFTRSCSTIARTNRSMLPNRGKKTRTDSQTNAPRFMLVPILPVQPAIFYNDAVMKSLCTDSKTHQLMAESGYSCTVVGRNKNLTKSDFICIITNSKRKMKVSALTRTFQNLMENLSIKFSNSDDNQRGSSIVCNNVQSEVNVDDSSSTPHGQDKQLTTSTTNLSNENDLDKNGEKIDKRSSSHSQSSNNENEQSISKIGQSNTGVEDSVHVTEQSSDGVKQSVNETGESSHGVEQSVSETGQASDGVEQSNNETGQLNHVVEQSVSEAGQSNHGVEQFVSETEKSNLGVEHSNNETGQLNHGGEQSVSEAGQSNHGVEQSGNECQKIQSHPETEPDCSRASMMEKISDTVQIVAESELNNLGTENPTKKSSTSKAPWSKDNDELDVGEVILYVEDNSDKLPQLFASWFNVDMTVLDQSNEGHILTAGLLHEGSIPVRQSNKVIMNMNKSTVSGVVNNQSDESITSDNQWEVVGTTDDLVFKFYEDTVCVLYKTVDVIKPSNKNFTKNMKLMNSQSEVIESVGLELLVKAIYSAKEHAGKQLGDALENTTVLVVSKEFVKQSSHLDQEEFYYMMSALNHPHVTKEVMKGLSKRAKDGKFAIEEETRFCVGCGSVFDTKLDYLSHLKANASHYEGKNICIHCGVCFGTGTELSIHIKFTHMKNWIEQAQHTNGPGTVIWEIDTKFEDQMLARHNRLDSCYKVKDYMKILRNGIGLLWNFGIYGNVIPLIPSGKLKCRFCHKVFWFSSSLSDHIKISHMRREEGKFLTSPCGADVSTFDIIANAIVGRKKENFEHMRKEDMYACIYETCSSVKHHGIATSVSSYKRVIVVSRSPSPMILYDVYLTSGWHCVVCGKQFPDRKLDLALQAHECSSKSSVIYIASSIRFGKQLEDFDVTFKMPGSKWEMQCKECKVSVSQYSYHEHKCIERTAQPPIRKLRCVGCNELFSMSTFVSHMMSAHTMKRECNICHKLLDSFDTNEKHVCIPSKSYHTTKRDIRKERSLLLDSFDTNEKHVCIPSKSYHTTKRDIRKERSLLDVELKSMKNDVPILELACYWKCIACMRSFRNLELLNSHIFKSHAALMKSCRFCEELILVDISQHQCQGKDEIKYAHRLAMLKGWMGTTMKHDIRMKCVKCSCLKHFCKKNVFPYQCHQNTCCLYCSRYASCAGAECRHCGGIFHKISHLKMHMLYQHDTTVEDNKHITAVEDKIESESESEDIFREVVENKREYLSRLAEKVLQRSNMKRKMEKEANDLQRANMKRKMEKETIDSLHSSKTRITSEANSLQMTTEPVVNSKAPKIRPARKRGARSPETLQRKRLRQEARQEANTCKICFEKCKNKKSLRKHMSAEHGVRKAQQEANTCKLCSEKCGNKIAFKKHMSAAHGVRTGAGKPRPTPYSCKLCSEKFSSRKALRKHVTAEHGIISDKSGFLTSKKMAVCDECGLAVGSGYMGTHKRRQHQVQEELYQCDVCQEKFHLQIKLKDHLSDVHSVPTKTSSFVLKEEHYLPSALTECKYCGEKVLKKAISRHIRLLHEKKPVMCDVCGLMYPSASKLYSHKQRHVAARRKKQNVSCPDCGKIVSKYSLKSHQKINHSKKNFVCEECGKRFSFAHMLNAHIRFIHEGHKPFTCDICNYKCYMKSSLRGHMKNHHS